MSKFWINDKISELPCNDCGGEVIEYSIPNDIWNAVIRPNGEHDKEYLCMDCFLVRLRATLAGVQDFELALEVQEELAAGKLDKLWTALGAFTERQREAIWHFAYSLTGSAYHDKQFIGHVIIQIFKGWAKV